MNTFDTAIRLAGKLSKLTASGKLAWVDAGHLGPWGELPGRVLKAAVEDGTFAAHIAEVPVPNSSITSYYFGVAEGQPEIFEAFAEGYPAEPTDEQRKLWRTLKDLYSAADDCVKGTWEKVEKFEQLLERLA